MEHQITDDARNECPSIVFTLYNGHYAINSREISSIMQLPKYETVPDSPPELSGIFLYRGKVVPMLDLRTLFGMPTLQQEYQEFSDMLEVRKQDHIRWVNELERCINSGERFTLATDPHKCAFGKWYDSYHNENNAIMFHLRKIEEPHKNLHHAAHDVADCNQEHSLCGREECLKDVLERTKNEYMPVILGILDEAKTLFKSVFHEMVLVLGEENPVGLVVDEVLAVEALEDCGDESNASKFHNLHYVSGIKKSPRFPGVILELDENSLLEAADMPVA